MDKGDGFFQPPPIGAYPRKVKATRKAPPDPELSVCSMYGHCYCTDKTVNDKAHKVCCMCHHQLHSRAPWHPTWPRGPSLIREDQAVHNFPGIHRMID